MLVNRVIVPKESEIALVLTVLVYQLFAALQRIDNLMLGLERLNKRVHHGFGKRRTE